MDMEKLFVVCWGSAGQDDDLNSKAFCGVHGLYKSLPDAKNGLLECKNQMYSEIVDNSDYDEEEKANAKSTTQVYGSVDEEYFEIDYDIGDVRCEIHIKIEEVTM